MDNKEIWQKLWQSLDMAYVRQQIAFYIFFLLWGALMGLVNSSYRYGPSMLPMAISIFALCGLIVLIPALWLAFRIFREPAGYRIYRATLSQPHSKFSRGLLYFTVVLEEPDGSKFLVDTNAVFHPHGFLKPLLEDYVNQTVTIAYNEDTEAVVVIG